MNEQPEATAKELFERLQRQEPRSFEPGQLRTLQRRVQEWRTAVARRLVLGAGLEVIAEHDLLAPSEEPIRLP